MSTEPQTGFHIAFNMFDTDGNERVDKQEFLVVGHTATVVVVVVGHTGVVVAGSLPVTASLDRFHWKLEQIPLEVGTDFAGSRQSPPEVTRDFNGRLEYCYFHHLNKVKILRVARNSRWFTTPILNYIPKNFYFIRILYFSSWSKSLVKFRFLYALNLPWVT